jgi:signal transduction histidine kinase
LNFFVYLRLVVLTAGTLLPFFWMVVILGHRRQRNFERIFFFLCLSLVFFFGASLLVLNAELFYGKIPPALASFSWTVLCVGLWFLPSLLIHLHIEYAQVRELLGPGRGKRLWLAGAYLPAVALVPRLYSALLQRSGFNFLLPSNSFGRVFQIWLVGALVVSAVWQWRLLISAPDGEQKAFHRALCFDLAWIGFWIALLHFLPSRWGWSTEQDLVVYTTVVTCFAVGPLIGLIRNVQRFNFLQIGRQQNLIYAVFAAFVALLYFSLIRRASLWLDPYLPPEATAAILLFLPLAFFEPLQRLVGRMLRQTAHREMDRVQRLTAEIQQEARQGNLARLVRFIEHRTQEEFELASAVIYLADPSKATLQPRVGEIGRNLESQSSENYFPLRQNKGLFGALHAKPHGAALSGETSAALEFLCEQLPGALDLCRLIEEKLQLERELAERERLALVGQMAASISHNLKNPLGSMKTILQVQLENPALPESIRGETKMVLEEVGRLATKLNQLLQYSRPAVRKGNGSGSCDPAVAVAEVTGVLSHEAEKRGVTLRINLAEVGGIVAASSEAVNDIVSNLVVNALEATPRGGHVTVSIQIGAGVCSLEVEDDGPGVPVALREKILQPFFTTKSQGTGLGLAIVARRVAEFGGKVEWESPVREGIGTKFHVELPREIGRASCRERV